MCVRFELAVLGPLGFAEEVPPVWPGMGSGGLRSSYIKLPPTVI